jgi:arylamine N-acetyltransferase
MAINYVGGYTSGGAANTTGTGLHFSLSGSSAAAGHVAIAVLYSRGSTKTVTNVSGVTQEEYAATANGGRIFVGVRVLTATDISNGYFGTYDLNSVSNATVGYEVAVFSGVEQTTPVRVSPAPVSGGASNVPNPPALTGGTAGDTVVVAFGKMDDCASTGTGNMTAPTSPGTYTIATGWQSTGGTDGSSCIAYRLSGTSATEDPGTWTTTSGGLSTYWYAATLALAPAPPYQDCGFTSEAKSSVVVSGSKADWVAEAGFTSEAKSAVVVTGSVTEAPVTYEAGFTSEAKSSVVVSGGKTDWIAEAGFTSEAKSSVVITGTITHAVWECGFTTESLSKVEVTGTVTEVGGATLEAGFTTESKSRVYIGRKNWFATPSFETDSDSNGLADNWGSSYWGDGTNTCQVVSGTPVSGGGSYHQRMYGQNVANDLVGASMGHDIVDAVPGTMLTVSAWYWGTHESQLTISIEWLDSGYAWLDRSDSADFELTSTATRQSLVGAVAPASTAHARIRIINLYSIVDTDAWDIHVDCALLEYDTAVVGSYFEGEIGAEVTHATWEAGFTTESVSKVQVGSTGSATFYCDNTADGYGASNPGATPDGTPSWMSVALDAYQFGAGGGGGANYNYGEAFTVFDLTNPASGSAPPAGSMVSNVAFSTFTENYGSALVSNRYAYAAEYDWGTSCDTGDWRTRAQLRALTVFAQATFGVSLPTGQQYSWTSQAAATAAVQNNIGGSLRLIIYDQNHINEVVPDTNDYCWIRSANGATATEYPRLTFDWSTIVVTHATWDAGFTSEAVSSVVVTGTVTEASGTTFEAGFTSESKTRIRVSAPGQPFLRNTLEGSDGVTVTNANTAPDNFTAVSIGSGATFAFDTARAVQGGSSVEIAATVSGQGASTYWDFTATPDVFTRAYVYMTAAPSSYHRLITLRASAADISSLRVDSSGQLYLYTGGGTSAAIALNQWVRVEFAAYNINGVEGYVEARLFNDPRSDTPTSVIGEYETTGMGECVRAVFGAISSCPADLHIWMDQFAVASDFWMGSEPFTLDAGFTSESVSSVVVTGQETAGGTTYEAGFTTESLSSVVVSGSKTDWIAEAGFTSEAKSSVVVAGSVTHWTAEAGFTSEAKSAVVVTGSKTEWTAEAGFTSEAKSAVVIAAGPIAYATGFTSEAKSSVVVSGAIVQWVAEAGFTSEAKSSVVITGQKAEWIAEAGFTSEAKSAVVISATKTDWVAEAGFTSEAVTAVAVTGIKLGMQEAGFTSEAKSAVVVTAGPTTSSRGFTSESVTSVVAAGTVTHATWTAGFTSEAKSSVVVSGAKVEAVWEAGFTSEAKSAVVVAGQKTDWTAEAGFTSEAVTKVEVAGIKQGAVYTLEAGFTTEAKSAVTVAAGPITFSTGFTSEGKSAVVISATKTDWTAEASFTSEAVTSVTISGTAAHAVWSAGFTSEGKSNVTIAGQKNGVFIYDGEFTSEAKTRVNITGTRIVAPDVIFIVGSPQSGWRAEQPQTGWPASAPGSGWRTSTIKQGNWTVSEPESGWPVKKPR